MKTLKQCGSDALSVVAGFLPVVDAISLVNACRAFKEQAKRIIPKRVDAELEKIAQAFGLSEGFLQALLQEGALIAGGAALGIYTGNRYDESDIDIFMTAENLPRIKQLFCRHNQLAREVFESPEPHNTSDPTYYSVFWNRGTEILRRADETRMRLGIREPESFPPASKNNVEEHWTFYNKTGTSTRSP